MDLLHWIAENRPGFVNEFDDRLEIQHECGEHSTLWFAASASAEAQLMGLGSLYREFDGCDLFSSTFKIASRSVPRSRQGVSLVFTLNQLLNETRGVGCKFPPDSIPFMYQAGIGYCAVSVNSSQVYECDFESGTLIDRYDSFLELMDDWLQAVS